MISKALTWLGSFFGTFLRNVIERLWEMAAWLSDSLFFALYGVWAYLWGYCANLIFGWIGSILGVLGITPGDAETFMAYLRAVNTWFPVDMIVTLMPAWAVFETSLLVIRIIIKGWR